jgi:hypothetical protein
VGTNFSDKEKEKPVNEGNFVYCSGLEGLIIAQTSFLGPFLVVLTFYRPFFARFCNLLRIFVDFGLERVGVVP